MSLGLRRQAERAERDVGSGLPWAPAGSGLRLPRLLNHMSLGGRVCAGVCA